MTLCAQVCVQRKWILVHTWAVLVSLQDVQLGRTQIGALKSPSFNSSRSDVKWSGFLPTCPGDASRSLERVAPRPFRRVRRQQQISQSCRCEFARWGTWFRLTESQLAPVHPRSRQHGLLMHCLCWLRDSHRQRESRAKVMRWLPRPRWLTRRAVLAAKRRESWFLTSGGRTRWRAKSEDRR